MTEMRNLQFTKLFSSLLKKGTCLNSFLVCEGVGSVRNFGIMQDYNERKNQKLINGFALEDRNRFWVTSSRPSNFGDPLDVKTKADNWFDKNR